MWSFGVPNAPCGVESRRRCVYRYSTLVVPNAPCGVESENDRSIACGLEDMFLMHRVELKAITRSNSKVRSLGFLMHRVELKVVGDNWFLDVVYFCS